MQTYVYDVAFVIDHDVTIMTVLNLKKIAENTVCGHATNKVSPCDL